MPASKIALDFLDYCEKQSSAAAIEERFVATLKALGYEYIACASHVDPLRPRPGGVSVLNYPSPWVKHYSEADFHLSIGMIASPRCVSAENRSGCWKRARSMVCHED